MKYAALAVTVGSLLATGFVVGRSTRHTVDNLAGKAAFHIERHGEEILMQPVVQPSFKLALLRGPAPVENEIVQCSVWSREIRRNPEDMKVFTVTVLRCGETEYGVSEVDFAFDDHKVAVQ